MSIRDDYDFSIIENTMKERVIDTLEKQLNEISDDDIDKSEECVMDMACYALNRLQPSYSATLYGSLYTRAEAENIHEQIEEIVKKAIEFVAMNNSKESK